MSEEFPPEAPPVEPPPVEELPPPVVHPAPQRWGLADSLTSLDRDYAGEALFCRSTISSLHEHRARHPGDHVVSGAYTGAIRALELTITALQGSEDKMAAHQAWLDSQPGPPGA